MSSNSGTTNTAARPAQKTTNGIWLGHIPDTTLGSQPVGIYNYNSEVWRRPSTSTNEGKSVSRFIC